MSFLIICMALRLGDVSQPSSQTWDIDSINERVNRLITSSQLDKAQLLVDSVLRVVQKTDIDSLLISRFHNNQALLYFKKGDLDSSLIFYQKSLGLVPDHPKERANRLKNMGLVFWKLNRLNDALNHTLSAVVTFEEHNMKNEAASAYLSLSIIYRDMKDYPSSLRAYSKVNTIWSKRSLEKLYILYNNIGNVWYELNNMDSAYHYYQRSLTWAQRYGKVLGSTYNNIGEVLLHQAKYDSARGYFQQSLRIKKKAQNKSGISYTYNMLAELHISQGNHALAHAYLDSARHIVEQTGSLSIKMKNLSLFRELYQQEGDFKQAFEVDQRHDLLKDSLFNEDKIKTLKTLSDYQLRQKDDEKQLAEREAELAKASQMVEERLNRNLLVFLSVVALLLFGTLMLLWILWRQRTKLNLLNQELDTSNQYISTLNKQNLHFTKNTLTELGAAIRLQLSDFESDSQTGQSLQEGRLRIEAVSALYKQLFLKKSDSDGVSVGKLVLEIAENTIEALLAEKQISVIYDLDDIVVTGEQGLSLGLLVNELVINACKHAFKDRSGVLSITAKLENDYCNLVISDDGPGMEDSSPNAKDSFGFKLINSLAVDLDAIWERKSDQFGLSYYFSFAVN